MYARSDRLVRIDDTFTCGHTLRQVRFRLASLFILLCVSFCPENVHLVWYWSVVLVFGIWNTACSRTKCRWSMPIMVAYDVVPPHSCSPMYTYISTTAYATNPLSTYLTSLHCCNPPLLLKTFYHHVSQDASATVASMLTNSVSAEYPHGGCQPLSSGCVHWQHKR